MKYQDLFSQCNNHLLESDKKRDQVVSFYIAIVGIFFANISGKNATENSFIVALAILGFLLSAIIVRYRIWHIRYINSAKIINYLLTTPEAVPGQAMQKLQKSIYFDSGISETNKFPKQGFLQRYFQGTEMLIYQAFLVVAFVPSYMAIQLAGFHFLANLNWIWSFIICLGIFLLLMNIGSIFYMYNDLQKSTPFATWILPSEEVNVLKKIVASPKKSFQKANTG